MLWHPDPPQGFSSEQGMIIAGRPIIIIIDPPQGLEDLFLEDGMLFLDNDPMLFLDDDPMLFLDALGVTSAVQTHSAVDITTHDLEPITFHT